MQIAVAGHQVRVPWIVLAAIVAVLAAAAITVLAVATAHGHGALADTWTRHAHQALADTWTAKTAPRAVSWG